MRNLLVALALVLPLSSPALAQLKPERPLPGLPPLLDPQDPAAPDAQAPDQQAPQGPQPAPGPQAPPDQQPGPNAGPPGQGQGPGPQAGRQGPQRPVPRQPETDEQLLTKLSQAKDARDARPL